MGESKEAWTSGVVVAELNNCYSQVSHGNAYRDGDYTYID